jgi:hypothetical protein
LIGFFKLGPSNVVWHAVGLQVASGNGSPSLYRPF